MNEWQIALRELKQAAEMAGVDKAVTDSWSIRRGATTNYLGRHTSSGFEPMVRVVTVHELRALKGMYLL